MIWPKGFKRRNHSRTLFDGMRTTRMERTAAGWVHRGWWVAGQQDALPLTLTARVGQWHSADERFGIRMQRALEYIGGRAKLDDFAEIHHGDAVRDVFYDGKIVRDENHGQTHLARKVEKQIDDLRLN